MQLVDLFVHNHGSRILSDPTLLAIIVVVSFAPSMLAHLCIQWAILHEDSLAHQRWFLNDFNLLAFVEHLVYFQPHLFLFLILLAPRLAFESAAEVLSFVIYFHLFVFIIFGD